MMCPQFSFSPNPSHRNITKITKKVRFVRSNLLLFELELQKLLMNWLGFIASMTDIFDCSATHPLVMIKAEAA